MIIFFICQIFPSDKANDQSIMKLLCFEKEHTLFLVFLEKTNVPEPK